MTLRASLFVLPAVLLAAAACSSGSTTTSGAPTGPGTGADGGGTGPGTGTGDGGAASALGPTTFLFAQRHGDNEWLVAMDYVTKEQRVISTLAEGTVEGWNLDGIAISPDRTRIAFASRFGATAEDVATNSSYNRIHVMNTNGEGLVRLTPVYEHASSTRYVDVREPVFNLDGTRVIYDHGESDTGTSGYVSIWSVAADGSELPSSLDLPKNNACAVNNDGLLNPKTGDLLVEHSVCIGAEPSGYFSYPSAGGEPVQLFDDDGATLTGGRPVFSSDGAAILFVARPHATQVTSIYLLAVATKQVGALIEGSADIDVLNPALSPDDSHLIYCRHDRTSGAHDLHVVDLTTDPIQDTPLTTDGVSCEPVF